MPATAGRVRMPANNRVHSSAALQTHGIWQSAIGYDPYAPTKDNSKPKPSSEHPKPSASGDDEPAGDGENAYNSFQGLLALARITGTTTDETRGACKKCHRVGHLTFQCRNFLSVRDDKFKEEDAAAIEAALDKIKKTNNLADSSEDDDDDTDSSDDSDADPEMEKLIAARLGNKTMTKDSSEKRSSSHRRMGRPKKRSRKRSSRSSDEDSSGDENIKKEKAYRRHRKSRKDRKRRGSHRSSSDDSDESGGESDRHHRHKRSHRHHRQHRRERSASSGSEGDGPSATRKKKHSEKKHKSERRRG